MRIVLWGASVLVLAALGFFGATALVQEVVVPNGSMENILQRGDRLIATRDTSVTRGDIIVYLSSDSGQANASLISLGRVVGLPGDHLHIVNKQLVLNGVPREEPYVTHRAPSIDSYRDNFPGPPKVAIEAQAAQQRARELLEKHVEDGNVVVPTGAYFVLGDNRDESVDSRNTGFVQRDHVVGKPAVVWMRTGEGLMFREVKGYPLGE